MRTNIVIDDKLIEKGFKYTGMHSKKELVDFALRELIKRKERKKSCA
jgi:Arc/MetJ family transcription regulator